MQVIKRDPSQFEQDLVLGQAVEQYVIDLLRSRFLEFGVATVLPALGKDYDFAFAGAERTVAFEIKYDRMAEATGNVAIEISCNGSSSGITATKATYWIHVIPKRGTYLLDAALLHEYVLERASVFGGDGGRAQLVLIPVSVFLELPFTKLLGPAYGTK